jgi:hypothetical protein
MYLSFDWLKAAKSKTMECVESSVEPTNPSSTNSLPHLTACPEETKLLYVVGIAVPEGNSLLAHISNAPFSLLTPALPPWR